jgi:hypothetical protein
VVVGARTGAGMRLGVDDHVAAGVDLVVFVDIDVAEEQGEDDGAGPGEGVFPLAPPALL